MVEIEKPDLRACPFCGAEAKFDIKPEDYGYTPEEVRVKCCQCFAESPYWATTCWTPKRGHFDTRQIAFNCAARDWNRRSGA